MSKIRCESIRVFTRLRGRQTCWPSDTKLRVWLLLSMDLTLGSLGFLHSQITTNMTPWPLWTSSNSSNFISFNLSFFNLLLYLLLFRLSSLTFSRTSMAKKVGSFSSVAFFLAYFLGLFFSFSWVWWVLHIS